MTLFNELVSALEMIGLDSMNHTLMGVILATAMVTGVLTLGSLLKGKTVQVPEEEAIPCEEADVWEMFSLLAEGKLNIVEEIRATTSTTYMLEVDGSWLVDQVAPSYTEETDLEDMLDNEHAEETAVWMESIMLDNLQQVMASASSVRYPVKTRMLLWVRDWANAQLEPKVVLETNPVVARMSLQEETESIILSEDEQVDLQQVTEHLIMESWFE
jgi:hypothetical protein